MSRFDATIVDEDVSPACQAATFCVGGVSFEISSCETNQDFAVPPGLRAFRAEGTIPDIAIDVEWLPVIEKLQESSVFDSGCTWNLYDRGSEYCFDFYVAALGATPYKRLVVDKSFSRGHLRLNREAFDGGARGLTALGYPLDELLIMHRLTQEKAIELHGTGIVRADGVGNLFVGHSGAGKSTTTRLWIEMEDVEVLSDDRIIVRRDADRLPQDDAAVEKAGILRLRDCSATPTNLSAQDDKAKKKMRMYGTPWHGEAMYASPNSAPLSRIFVLEHGHGNVITPLTPSQAVAELFARSFVPFHRHEYVDSALTFLQELVDSVPVYRYSFEPDQRAVEKIRNFHD
jgi:hypothetical protein